MYVGVIFIYNLRGLSPVCGSALVLSAIAGPGSTSSCSGPVILASHWPEILDSLSVFSNRRWRTDVFARARTLREFTVFGVLLKCLKVIRSDENQKDEDQATGLSKGSRSEKRWRDDRVDLLGGEGRRSSVISRFWRTYYDSLSVGKRGFIFPFYW